MPGSHASGPANPRERIEVTIRLNRRNDSREDIASVIEKISKHHGEHRHLSHEEFAALYGAHPNDIRKILAFAHDHDLTVIESSVDRRSVMLSGTIEDINRAFDVELTTYHHADGNYRGHHGPIHVPAEIHAIVEGVF